jgi:serine/threonine protein kinase
MISLVLTSAPGLPTTIRVRSLLQGVQDWHAVATVMREVARGLAYMHTSGRIHRDLKAANILVAPDGRVCLAGVPFHPETNSQPE